MLQCVSVLHFFLLLNNIPLDGFTTFYLSTHPCIYMSIHQVCIWVAYFNYDVMLLYTLLFMFLVDIFLFLLKIHISSGTVGSHDNGDMITDKLSYDYCDKLS